MIQKISAAWFRAQSSDSEKDPLGIVIIVLGSAMMACMFTGSHF